MTQVRSLKNNTNKIPNQQTRRITYQNQVRNYDMEARRKRKGQNRRRQRNNTKINEIKSLLFVKINKTDKILDKLSKKEKI